MPRLIDIKNQRFGKWTALYRDGSSADKSVLWMCRCDCGTLKRVKSKSLRQLRSLQCRRCVNKKPGAAFRKVWRAYQNAAKGRNLKWKLSKTYFKKLVLQNCHYCNALPSTKYEATSGEIFICNGVDRKYNEVGYTIPNSLACCTTCNMAKRCRTYEEFKSWISQVYKFWAK